MTTIIEIEEEPVAVVFGMLDYNPIIKKIDGKLFPFGFLRVIFGRKRLETVRMVGTYVVPKYQKWGLGLVLMFRVIPDARNWGIKEGEFSWVLESNKLSRGTLERAGAELQKTYRMYDIEFK
jgi:GNAT superfamily N-acetyltransferase